MTAKNKAIFALGFTANLLICTAMYYAISSHDWPAFLRTWALLAIIPATYLSGRLAGFISATFHAVLCWLIFSDPWQILTTVSAGYVVAGFLGYAQERRWIRKDEAERNEAAAEFVDNINGNLAKLGLSVRMLDQFIGSIEYLEREALTTNAMNLRGQLADLLTSTKGWHQLALERGFVEKVSDDERHTV